MPVLAFRSPVRPRPATALAALVALAACSADPVTTAPTGAAPRLAAAPAAASAAEFVPGEVLVRFTPGVTAEAREVALRAVGGRAAERIITNSMRRRGDAEGWTLVRTGAGVQAAIDALRASGVVEFAEPNWVYKTDATSNDPYYTNGSLWGMSGATTSPANPYGSAAAAAWANNRTDCSGVYVGIIDEGYYFDHVDLQANAGVNPGEVAGNGRDDDGNGLVDDVRGWDFANNDATVSDGIEDDHGTHVAGTIGGAGGNGGGVAGVCWKVKLLSAKFLGSNGGTTANAIKAVDYFTDLKTRQGLNLVATNNSWGGGGYSRALEDAIERANAAGILFVAAAGNSAYDCETTTACYPAEYPNANVIAVASITSTGALSSFSNYGASVIDIGAPGSGIWSTVPTGNRRRPTSGYASYNGTSMATPHVTGAAALYAAYHGGSAAQIKDAILSRAVATPSLAGKVATNGRLNVSGF